MEEDNRLKSRFYDNLSYAYDELAKKSNKTNYERVKQLCENARDIYRIFYKEGRGIKGLLESLNQLERDMKIGETR